jgi:hypothetical protein
MIDKKIIKQVFKKYSMDVDEKIVESLEEWFKDKKNFDLVKSIVGSGCGMKKGGSKSKRRTSKSKSRSKRRKGRSKRTMKIGGFTAYEIRHQSDVTGLNDGIAAMVVIWVLSGLSLMMCCIGSAGR